MSEQAPRPPDSELLVTALRNGDPHALGPLAERYRPYLTAMARGLLKDRLPGECSSVVQECLVAAVEHREQFRGATAKEFLGWLAAILRNRALNRLKRANRLGPLPDASSAAEPLASGTSPSEQAMRRERAAQVCEAVARLPEKYRVVITLRSIEGWSFEAIAGQLGLRLENVRQRWSRAIRQLRDELGEDDDSAPASA